MTKLEKVLTFSCRGSTGKAEMKTWETKAARPPPTPNPRRKHFSSEKPEARWKILWRLPAHSAKRAFPSCPHTSILSLFPRKGLWAAGHVKQPTSK